MNQRMSNDLSVMSSKETYSSGQRSEMDVINSGAQSPKNVARGKTRSTSSNFHSNCINVNTASSRVDRGIFTQKNSKGADNEKYVKKGKSLLCEGEAKKNIIEKSNENEVRELL